MPTQSSVNFPSINRRILNIYATRDSQTKFEANHMKNSRVVVLRPVEEKKKEEKEEDEQEEICQH